MIYFTSDLHFGHDKEFIYKPRGFNSIEDHDNTIIENWNNIVTEDDDVYVLGDLMLGDKEYGLNCLKRLRGKIHIVVGNHDTTNKIDLYATKLNNVVEIKPIIILKYNKYKFYLSHYPTITSNLEKDSLKDCLINLYGHTHQTTKFYNEMPFMYNVGLDCHQNKPISIDEIISDCEEKVKECYKLLED